ncbi:MAG: hypothetical protein JOY99_04350 [Sphingomonadaceae bacterium]|nr:hypothetical protein [Sphingomonadaceae bacterium]
MTPTAERLQARLDDRYRWFRNEWFFKWHYIGRDGPVSIDTFDGRSAHYGGIAFSGTARQVYWDAVVRGLRKEITDQLAWVDAEVRNYNPATAVRAIDECAGQIISFVRLIRRDAVEKDRILRSNGTEFPPENDAGRWEDTDGSDIQARANALKAALPFAVRPSGFRERSLAFWNANQGWLQILAIASAIIGIVAIVAAK